MVTASGKAFPRAHLGDSNVVLVARALRFACTQSAPAGLRFGQSDRRRRLLKIMERGQHRRDRNEARHRRFGRGPGTRQRHGTDRLGTWEIAQRG
jgi:hypothetical protein